MRLLTIICLFVITACSSSRNLTSQDSIAFGNIQVTAVKKTENQDVCFDISLYLKESKQADAQVSNWSLAWIDNKNHYHLLTLNQRDPASAPQGQDKEWSNHFKTCAGPVEIDEVKGLILTPKELPHNNQKGLHLNWN